MSPQGEKRPAGKPIESTESKKVKPTARSSSPEMRRSYVEKGALLLRVVWQAIANIHLQGPWSVPGAASVPEAEKNYTFNKVDGQNSDAREKPYRNAERKGFRVVKGTGCFAPHAQYCTKGGGASEKGYQLAFFALHGFVPKQQQDKKPDPATGKDTSWQLSHLCHKRWCCRLDHLVVEQAWRNRMRNYCLGPIRKFRLPDGRTIETCGCSLQFHVMGQPEMAGPPCVAAYTVSPDSPPDNLDICRTFAEAGHVLKETNWPLKVMWVAYTSRDAISEIRQLQVSDPAKAKAKVALLSPASKTFLKKGGTIRFDELGSFDPANRTVTLLAEDE